MEKRRRWALGTMSGTSLDGVDAAMILTDGQDVLEFGQNAYRPYSDQERDVLRDALGQWSGPAVEAAAEVVEMAHAELLASFRDAELIGFHGQTLAHDPERGRTLQVGNGAILADALGLPVVWDFRSVDVSLGGQGAPLAPFYHFALARHLKAETPVSFLNIGGVSNLTWVDPSKSAPEADGALLAFDTGPGNALINDLMTARRGQPFDRDGVLAAAGVIDEAVLETMLRGKYLSEMPPKSLDRNDFSRWSDLVEPLSDADAAATLSAGTAAAIATGLEHCPVLPEAVLVTGGGRLNPTLMDMLAGLLPCTVLPVEDEGLNGDMLEAEAFAHLAVRVQDGRPTSAPGTTGVPTPVGGGQISFPSSS